MESTRSAFGLLLVVGGRLRPGRNHSIIGIFSLGQIAASPFPSNARSSDVPFSQSVSVGASSNVEMVDLLGSDVQLEF